MNPPECPDLLRFLQPYPQDVQELTLAARAMLWERFQPVTEIFWDATNAVCAGFTYTHSTNDNFLNLAVYAKHVTLIFPWGVRLEDPEVRLAGEGNRVRNMRLEDGMGTLLSPYVQDLIDQAHAIAPRPAAPLEPTTIIKVMAGPKKRPTG